MRCEKYFLIILTVKVFFTFFAVYVFQKFAQLGDTERYLSAILDTDDFFNRTRFTDNIFSVLMFFLSYKLVVNIFIACIFSVVFFSVLKNVFYSKYTKLAWLIFFLPSFQIWTSVAGKEVLAIMGFLLVIKYVVCLQFNEKCNVLYLVVGIFLGVLLRPHYGLAYIYLLLSSIILARIKFDNISSGAYFLFLLLLSIILIICISISIDLWLPYFTDAMKIIRSYFILSNANASREYIEWGSVSDYFDNIFWGVTYSIVGPTFSEVLHRIIYTPFFIEGVVSFCLIIILLYKLYCSSQYFVFYRKFLYLSFLPSFIIILMIHYPFGIFNPGAAIRYKQNITPLIYFYPLLVLSYIEIIKNRFCEK
ncbi:hypothetical protein ACTZGB_05600 [Yersinia bercovieri]|uniref:hypothetical protein n=1 Tax=Yersinia bercovieri TaxID=634 RepID=UPI003FD88CDA